MKSLRMAELGQDTPAAGVVGAPTAAQNKPQHRADQIVSAGRIFSAALHTARDARMSPGAAMQAALRCALRHTGIDWQQELGIEIPTEPAPQADPLRERVASYLASRDSVEIRDVIAHLEPGGSSRNGTLTKRVGATLRALGWKPLRQRDRQGAFVTRWRASTRA